MYDATAEFKIDDRVRCVSAMMIAHYLTVGQIYTVSNRYEKFVELKELPGHNFLQWRFVLANESYSLDLVDD